MSETEVSEQAVAATIAEFERLAIGTGEWDGTDAVEFSSDGIAWSLVFIKTDEHQHPEFARATVYRKGVQRPVVVVIAWGESVPADDEWRALWEARPHKLFGAAAVRAAMRRGFRDVILDAYDADEIGPGAPRAPKTAAAPTGTGRDWLAEVAAADTLGVIAELWKDARAAREVTVALEKAKNARKVEIETDSTVAILASLAPKPTPATVAAATKRKRTRRPKA